MNVLKRRRPLRSERNATLSGRKATLSESKATRFCLLILVILPIPIFAHGCHGEDVDNEPGVIPISHNHESEVPH